MQLLRVLLILTPIALLAGCASLDTAKEQVDEVRSQLDEAKRDLDEARARFDRVKSATVVREEILHATITAREDDDGVLRFDVNASRGGALIPRANLTSLAPIEVRAGMEVAQATWIQCDPLSCAIDVPEGGEAQARVVGAATIACAPLVDGCAFDVAGARAWVTTAVSDVTA